MNILIVTQYFWPETFRINDLAVDLKNKGHEVTVLTGIPNYPGGAFYSGYGWIKKRRENFNGISVIRAPLFSRGKGGGLRLALNYLSFAFFASLISLFSFRKQKFDVIFVFEPSPITVGFPALVLKKIKKVPVLFWVQDLWPESLSATGAVQSQRMLNWVRRMVQFIYRGCNRILVQSKAFIPAIEQLGVPSSKVLYFPNAAEDLYSSDFDESKTGPELPSGFRVIYAGNIGAAQSFETVVGAALLLKEQQDIHWVIIGDGRQKPWLIEQVAHHGLQTTVHLVDQKPVEAMPDYFNQADALLVNLKRDPVFAMTIPSKVQSYLACGRPILAALDGEAGRIVQEAEAGLVSPAEDAKSLASNVLALYNSSPQKRAEMGQNGREYFIKHFEKRKLINQLEGWMKEIVEESK